MAEVVDMEKWVRKWAKEEKYSSIEIDWGRVVVAPSPPRYTPHEQGRSEGSSEVVAEYNNNTNKCQTHTVEATRTMHNEWSLDLQTGFSRGSNYDVSMKTPCEVTKYGFPSVVDLRTSSIPQSVQSSLALELSTPVQVQPYHKATVSIVTSNEVYRGTFKQDIRVRGKVKVNRYIDSKFDNAKEITIKELARLENRGNHVTVGGLSLGIDVHVEGSCYFRVVSSQKIRVDESPLRPLLPVQHPL